VRRADYVRMDGAQALDEALAGGRGAIVVTGHCGNWELLAAWVAASGYPLTVVVRRVNDARFDALIVDFRRAAGVEVLVRDDPAFLRAVTDALRRNRLVALLIDQDMRGAGVFVPFFGRPARTPPGAAVIALRARVPVVTAFIHRRPEGGHVARFGAVPTVARRAPDAVRELTARLTAAIGYLVSRSMTARQTGTLQRLGAEILPQVAQRIQNFKRVKVKDGRTVWEITAAEAQYFEEQAQIVVREPRMRFFLEDGEREARIDGREGRIKLDGRELDAITMHGAVTGRLDDLQLETEEATYDRTRDVITSPALVTVRGRTIELRGRGMEVDVGPQHVRLLDDVHTTLRSDAASS
jgi:LPS export ABC transporter protein LptC